MKLSLSTSLSGFTKSAVPFVGPLDDYTEGLALALLPFRGFAGYTGPGWRVRDDGAGYAEQDTVFDTTSGDTVYPTLVGNGLVRTWYDQSGLGKNHTSSSDTYRPTLVGAVLSGHPVVRFNGTTNTLSPAVLTLTTAWTYYYVGVKRTAASGSTAKYALSLSPTTRLCADQVSSGGAWYKYNGSSGPYTSLGGSVTQWSVHAEVLASGQCHHYINNSAKVDLAGSGLQAPTLQAPANRADCDTAALLVYSASHSDATRQAIQSILAAKFGITLAP